MKKIQPLSKSIVLDTDALPLPKIIRFCDDFSDRIRTIIVLEEDWRTIVDGSSVLLNWEGYQEDVKRFLRLFLSWAFTQYDPTSVVSFMAAINGKKEEISIWVNNLSDPNSAKQKWEANGYNQLRTDLVTAIRAMSLFICEVSLFGWSRDDLEYLRGWNWFSLRGQSAVVHGDSYYLSSAEEMKLVSYFDRLSKSKSDNMDLFRDALLLYFSYAFGLRPIQISGLLSRDVNITEVLGRRIAHVTFYQAKQRSRKKEPILRKVKREWSSILFRYANLDIQQEAARSEKVHSNSFFNLTPAEASAKIVMTSKSIIGRPITPSLFRHIAAQRMADLGMSQLELAEFMGHASVRTCLVYFENSAIQGQIVNRALGLSPIYQKIRSIADNDFISGPELLELPSDKQVGGAAHAIPLAGIGGCSVGQSLCELSPAISCYTCPKFLPLAEVEMHEKVAKGLRQVIVDFERAGRNDQTNPAYTQLTRSMEKITAIITDLETMNE